MDRRRGGPAWPSGLVELRSRPSPPEPPPPTPAPGALRAVAGARAGGRRRARPLVCV